MNRKTAPKYYDAVDFDLRLKPYTSFKLTNQVPVFMVNAGAEEVAMVEFTFYAGNWFESKRLLAAATNYLLKSGTIRRKAFDIEAFVDFEGAYLSKACYNETASLTLHCLTKHLPELLPLVKEIFTESIFPEDEWTLFRNNAKQKLAVNLLKCDFVANRMIDERIYGFDHPYGTYTRAEDYDAVHIEDIRAYFNEFYTNGNCLIFAAGRLPDSFADLMQKYFGDMPWRSDTTAWKKISHPQHPSAEKETHIINDKDGVQVAIRLGRPFPDRHHPDFQKVQILNVIFGGYFGSRLMSNIREEKGYTYGIQSYIQNHIGQTAWMITTEGKRDKSQQIFEEISREMNRLKNTPVSDDELSLVKNYMIGSILSDLDGPFQIIARWRTYIMNGLDADYFYKAVQNIKTITSEELLSLAQHYFNEGDFYKISVV